MTRDEFIEKHRHELMGIITDAALLKPDGAMFARWLREQMRRMDVRLVAIYEEFNPPPKPAAPQAASVNGKPAQPEGVKNEGQAAVQQHHRQSR